MNFYTVAAKMNKQINKQLKQLSVVNAVPKDELKQTLKNIALNEFDENLELGLTLMLRYKEKAMEMGLIQTQATRTYCITVRPHDKNFELFYKTVQKFLDRACFEKIYACSFEQKGTSDDTLGQGFHVHIIAKMKQRSKTEVLRDAKSTFGKLAADNCIDVEVCKNPESFKQGYLIEYKSADEHKILTKQWDEQWREKMGLLPYYEDTLPNQVRVGSVSQTCGTTVTVTFD